MAHVIYDDGTYQITHAVFATPRRFYPIVNTTARIRRDPLWIGAGIAGFSVVALAVYGDLLYPLEILTLIAIAVISLAIGHQVSLLSIDAWGHERATVCGRTKKIRTLYRAIRDARTADYVGSSVLAANDITSEKNR